MPARQRQLRILQLAAGNSCRQLPGLFVSRDGGKTFEQIAGDAVNSSNVKVASIGPVTSEQLKNLGLRVDVQATEHTIDGLLAAIEKMYK